MATILNRLTIRLQMMVALAALMCVAGGVVAADQPLNKPPMGFTALFDGKTLDGWFGHGTKDPSTLWEMSAEQLEAHKEKTREDIRKHWRVENGELVNDGKGLYLTTNKNYRDFELLLEYKTVPKADSGIYLRGVPQVQIWDTTKEGGKWKIGADKGSGGLWNNSKGAPGKDPSKLMDKPFGEWNKFRIIMIGERVTVYLNGEKVVDDAVMENYFNRKAPIFATGPIQLQTHGGEIRWRNVFIREISAEEAAKTLAARETEGFESIFNGKDFSGWAGPTKNYKVNDGAIEGGGGTIYTDEEYDDFKVKFEFKVPPGGNNGLAIRYPGKGDTAYVGMCELQVLDNSHPGYAKLRPAQYHGSAYSKFAAHRGFQRPVGEWNYQEVTVKGSTIKVELNGTVILDCDFADLEDMPKHPGMRRTKGHFGFAGHGSLVQFRNIQMKRLEK